MFCFSARARHGLLALLTGLCVHTATQAAPYSDLVFFGDSLLDTGNVYLASGGVEPPSPPYYQGRLSNGPTWVEHLAAGLGLATTSTAWLAGGHNYAWAGAFSGMDGLAGAGTGLQAQVLGQWGPSHPVADPSALYVVGIGGNDLRYVNALHQPTATPYSTPDMVLGNLMFTLNALVDAGVRHLLVSNIPDLGLVPESEGHRAESTAAAASYNAMLSPALASLAASRGVQVMELDLFGLLNDIVADSLSGGVQFGLTNASVPCLLGGVSCDTSVFFDFLHPTATVHALTARAALDVVAAHQVPEPATPALLVVALLGWWAVYQYVSGRLGGRRPVPG